mgnify:CR=1 FL=1
MSGFGYNVLGFGAFPNRSVEAGITSNAENVSAKAQFNATIWASGTPKILNISSGVTLGGTSGTAALTIESDLGGSLLINNAGTITGTGGAAGTSGAGGNGGNAILNSGGTIVSLVNSGTISGGGGGGGKGGTGGNGSYTSDSGFLFNISTGTLYYWVTGSSSNPVWAGSVVAYNVGVYSPFTYTTGGFTYYRGTERVGGDNYSQYEIKRVGTVSSSGGAGGNGGTGAGYNQSQANGSSGASGGTNAGAGGTGGNGGNAGANGSAGATGASGNSTSGGSGSAAGTAGKAVSGAVNFTDASGTTNGTVDST